MNTEIKRLPAPFPVGTKVRYVGRLRLRAPDGNPIIEYGMVGEIVEMQKGRDAEVVDAGGAIAMMGPIHDCSIVRIGTFRRAITSEPDSINRWEVIL